MNRVAITVDIETDWGGRLTPGAETISGIHIALPKVLELFRKAGIKATFFISGEVVNHAKDELRLIHEGGHEIGSHGFHHCDLSKLSKAELQIEIIKSKDTLENAFNADVIGFRAPQLRIHDEMFYLLPFYGFKYDSSMIQTVFPGRYGNISIPNEPFQQGNITEIPISTIPYLRLPMGLLWINALGFKVIRMVLERASLPSVTVLYFHLFDILQTKNKSDFSLIVRTWYNFRASRVLETLDALLQYWQDSGCQFLTLKQILHQER